MANVKTDFSRYEIRYQEFPELLFTVRGDGCEYFDATLYIKNKGDPNIHSLQGFKTAFSFWINTVQDTYSLSEKELFIIAPNGHQLIDYALALLFVTYIDPGFGVYMMERMSDMLLRGVVLSDTCLLLMAKDRLSKELLTENL